MTPTRLSHLMAGLIPGARIWICEDSAPVIVGAFLDR